MTPAELRDYALKEIDELSPEPSGAELALWREERAGVPSSSSPRLADDGELLRQAANQAASEWTDRDAARLLVDAATLAEIGA